MYGLNFRARKSVNLPINSIKKNPGLSKKQKEQYAKTFHTMQKLGSKWETERIILNKN